MTYEETLKLLEQHEYWAEFSYFDEMAKTAIEAVKKQIPKKPIQKYKHINEYMYCPICDEYIANRYAEYKPPFCKHCGQAIDWSAENDG